MQKKRWQCWRTEEILCAGEEAGEEELGKGEETRAGAVTMVAA